MFCRPIRSERILIEDSERREGEGEAHMWY